MTKSSKCRVCGIGYQTVWARKTICPRCDIKVEGIRISSSMAASLVFLITGKATARSRSAYVEQGLPHRSALRSRGLINSEYVAAKRRTFYWVTSLGMEVVRRWKTTRAA